MRRNVECIGAELVSFLPGAGVVMTYKVMYVDSMSDLSCSVVCELYRARR